MRKRPLPRPEKPLAAAGPRPVLTAVSTAEPNQLDSDRGNERWPSLQTTLLTVRAKPQQLIKLQRRSCNFILFTTEKTDPPDTA